MRLMGYSMLPQRAFSIAHQATYESKPKYSEVQTGITASKVVSSSLEKNYQIDSKINGLLKVADARSMYYT